MNDWLVLLVLWDENGEAVCQQVGREAGISMLTTTVARLAKYGAVGGSELLVDVQHQRRGQLNIVIHGY